MSCNITKGRLRTCKNNIAGISEIYITKYKPLNRFNSVFKNGVELKMIPDTLFYKFEVKGLNSSFSESMQVEDAGKHFNTNLTLSLVKLEIELAEEIESLVNSVFHIVVKLNNGNYYFLGFENGLELTSLDINSGVSLADFQGYNLTFTGTERYKGMLISDFENSGIKPVFNPVFIWGGNTENEVISYDNKVIETKQNIWKI